jgi:hypothetical protein
MTRPRLVVLIDGAPMPEAEARAFWTRFSEHMEAHQGDLTGFARQNGFGSVSPEYRAGQAVLVVRTKEAQAKEPQPGGKASAGKPAKKRKR